MRSVSGSALRVLGRFLWCAGESRRLDEFLWQESRAGRHYFKHIVSRRVIALSHDGHALPVGGGEMATGLGPREILDWSLGRRAPLR